MTKRDLYIKVECIRKSIGAQYTLPYNAKTLCTNAFHLNLDEDVLCTPGLRGMSHIPSRTVFLDNKKAPIEQNFFCMHEIMHHQLHGNGKTISYSSYETTQAHQDPFIEWQANEGAAQFLVPFQNFIPDYVATSRSHARESVWKYDCDDLYSELASHYFVSPRVIQNRISSLQYEICYYLKNQTLKGVRLVSKTRLGLEHWNESASQKYCLKCLAVLSEKHTHCQICGAKIYDPLDSGFKQYGNNTQNSKRGIGYMIYKGITQDENFRAAVCPRCGNEEMHLEGKFCQVCGALLTNECAYTDIDGNSYNQSPPCCDTPLPGNARYCPHCGNETTYYTNGFLKPWDYKVKEPGFINPETDGDLPF